MKTLNYYYHTVIEKKIIFSKKLIIGYCYLLINKLTIITMTSNELFLLRQHQNI